MLAQQEHLAMLSRIAPEMVAALTVELAAG
jgi:hypothetical protein